MIDPLPLERLRLPFVTPVAPKESARLPRHQGSQRFLKGPIPLSWIETAARLPGKALHVGLAVWFLAGMKRARNVKLGRATLAAFGVKRHAGARSLRALERASLVAVVRHTGRSPDVTLLPARAGSPGADDILEGPDTHQEG